MILFFISNTSVLDRQISSIKAVKKIHMQLRMTLAGNIRIRYFCFMKNKNKCMNKYFGLRKTYTRNEIGSVKKKRNEIGHICSFNNFFFDSMFI